MRPPWLAVGLMMSIASSPLAVGDGPELAELRAIVGNPAIPVEERARRALDGSASLDQAAQQAAQASERRAKWSQAVGLLDEFLSKDPQADASPLIRFQAAVYRWAEGRSFAEQAELAPAEAKLRAGAIEALDDSTRRLRSIEVKPIEAAEPFGQNVRFRLAQSIADRAKLDPDNEPGRLALEREALAMLDASLSMPGFEALRPATPGRTVQPPGLVRTGPDGDRAGGEADTDPARRRRARSQGDRARRAAPVRGGEEVGGGGQGRGPVKAPDEGPDPPGEEEGEVSRSGSQGDRRRGVSRGRTVPGGNFPRGASGLDGTGEDDRRARPRRPARLVGPPRRGASTPRRPGPGRPASTPRGPTARRPPVRSRRRRRSATRRVPTCSRPGNSRRPIGD